MFASDSKLIFTWYTGLTHSLEEDEEEMHALTSATCRWQSFIPHETKIHWHVLYVTCFRDTTFHIFETVKAAAVVCGSNSSKSTNLPHHSAQNNQCEFLCWLWAGTLNASKNNTYVVSVFHTQLIVYYMQFSYKISINREKQTKTTDVHHAAAAANTTYIYTLLEPKRCIMVKLGFNTRGLH